MFPILTFFLFQRNTTEYSWINKVLQHPAKPKTFNPDSNAAAAPSFTLTVWFELLTKLQTCSLFVGRTAGGRDGQRGCQSIHRIEQLPLSYSFSLLILEILILNRNRRKSSSLEERSRVGWDIYKNFLNNKYFPQVPFFFGSVFHSWERRRYRKFLEGKRGVDGLFLWLWPPLAPFETVETIIQYLRWWWLAGWPATIIEDSKVNFFASRSRLPGSFPTVHGL